ncbi:trypco2 family protein [uncultured Roseobacter sp.]|uniref:trypco2 family protein n=1 Tax=uncultured Roseobacter sp. TaxID=114847 RepID=UPI0026232469|nr:trypco2 family protein [uncultured Roseobacter sp.]
MSIGLKDLIFQVRQDLLDVEQTVKGDGRLFVKEIVFELHTVAVEKSGTKGGFDLKVITLGGDQATEHTQIHKITVKVDGSDGSNGRLKVSSPAPL